MPLSSPTDVTELLRAWSNGDGSALERLVPLVYQELRSLAQRYMRQERADHTLQATSLINEAYLRLIDVNRIQWQSRAHFIAAVLDLPTLCAQRAVFGCPLSRIAERPNVDKKVAIGLELPPPSRALCWLNRKHLPRDS